MATSVRHLQPDLPQSASREPRLPVRMWASIETGRGRENAVVHDLSTTGFRIETRRRLVAGNRVSVTIGAETVLPATVVRASSLGYGCRLDAPLAAATLDLLTRDGPFAPVPPLADEPDGDGTVIERLPFATRALVIAGGALGAWAMLIGSSYALLV